MTVSGLLTTAPACLQNGCQTNIFSLEKESGKSVVVYTLNTVGVMNMVTVDGVGAALGTDNVGSFPDTIAYYRNV